MRDAAMNTAVLSFLLLGSLLVSESQGRQTTPAASRTFVHPGISNTQQELDILRQRANSREDSLVKQGWEKLRESKLASLAYQPSPHARPMVVGSGTCPDEEDLHQDAMAAYSHALQWVATKDRRHSDKAIEILNAWSDVIVDIVPEKGRSQDSLEAAWYGPIYLSAAEILKHYDNGSAGWSKKDQKQFDQMVAVLKKEALKWDGWTSLPNQSISTALHRMALGVYTDDEELYANGLSYFVDDILTTDDPRRNTILPSGEVWEINRSPGGDCGHASYNIEGILDIAEMAWIQGDDLYSLRIDGEEIPRILKGVEYMAKCLGDGPVETSKEGLVSCSRLRPVSYEIAYNHYIHRRPGYALPYTTKLLKEKLRPTGGEKGKFLPWDTFTHGEISKKSP